MITLATSFIAEILGWVTLSVVVGVFLSLALLGYNQFYDR